MKDNTIDRIIENLKECDKTSNKIELLKYNTTNKFIGLENQFLIMIKPECLNYKNGVCIDKILQTFFNKLEEFNVEVNSSSIINGKYLKEYKLIENQYSILNKGAKKGLNSIPKECIDLVKSKFNSISIMGAYDFISKSGMSAAELEKISHERGSIKIGNGTYILLLEHDGKKFGIINAFHPNQLEHFYNVDNNIIVFNCSSNTNYEVLAKDLIGFFNPREANENSLRGYIFENSKDIGLENVGIFFNGFHISPSPLEGMFATVRYCIDNSGEQISILKTKLGKELHESGLSATDINMLSSNPYIKIRNTMTSVFDICEGKDNEYIKKFILTNYKNFIY